MLSKKSGRDKRHLTPSKENPRIDNIAIYASCYLNKVRLLQQWRLFPGSR